MRAANHLEQTCVVGYVVPIYPELTRVGAAILAHGGGLEPDELASASGEALVAAPGQLVGPAIGRRVAAFHGMDRQRVAHSEAANLDWACDLPPDLVRVFFESDVTGAELISRAPQLVQV